MIPAFQFNPEITLGDIISAISVLIALIAVMTTLRFENKHHKDVAFKEIYQQLELASIDLFRFESEHKDLVRKLWETEGSTQINESSTDYFIFTNYVCQHLNLFEMAVRFKNEKVMPDDVFGSWVTWMFDLSAAPGFIYAWKNCKYNYIRDLRLVMNKGVEISSNKELNAQQAKENFFQFIAENYKSETIMKWFETE